MSHQDRTSIIVINHETIKQVIDWLFVSGLFAGMRVHGNARWKPRMLAATALFWATSGLTNLGDRFEQGRKIVKKVFRWQGAPGATYQSFIEMLRKRHTDLMLAIVPHVRMQMKEVLPGQWEIAGYVVFAGDGSRIELARTKSLTTSPPGSGWPCSQSVSDTTPAPGTKRSRTTACGTPCCGRIGACSVASVPIISHA